MDKLEAAETLSFAASYLLRTYYGRGFTWATDADRIAFRMLVDLSDRLLDELDAEREGT